MFNLNIDTKVELDALISSSMSNKKKQGFKEEIKSERSEAVAELNKNHPDWSYIKYFSKIH